MFEETTRTEIFGDPEVWLRFSGRLHPLLVHFPIALLLVAFLVELFRRRKREVSNLPVVLVAFGFVGAAAAVGSGWAYAKYEAFGPAAERTIFLHRWSGVAVASLAAIALVSGLLRRRLPAADGVFRACLLLSAIGLAYGAHLGATLVHGSDYLFEVFEVRERAIEAPSEPPVELEVVAPPPVPVESQPVVDGELARAGASGAVSYARDVKPILEATCVRCHGPRKQKGHLRLDRREEVFKGEPGEWIIQPGDPDGSELLRRVTLPLDDLDFMPDGGDPLAPDEIATLRAWIEQGAEWDEADSVAVPAASDLVARAVEAEPVLSVDQIAARDAALERLAGADLRAVTLAQTSPLVEVDFGRRSDVEDPIGQLRGLESTLAELSLAGVPVGNAEVRGLAAFSALRRLRLQDTQTGDAALEVLAGLPALESLNLVGTLVTDLGIEHLARAPKLRRLYVWQTAVTPDGAAALRAARPDLEIVEGLVGLAPPEAEEPVARKTPACCAAAEARGGTCDHPCCVEASVRGEVCPKCSAG